MSTSPWSAVLIILFLSCQSSHARFCLEHFADWHDRGDLGEVFST